MKALSSIFPVPNPVRIAAVVSFFVSGCDATRVQTVEAAEGSGTAQQGETVSFTGSLQSEAKPDKASEGKACCEKPPARASLLKAAATTNP